MQKSLKNQTMRTKIRDNIRQGMPVLAEWRQYMYPLESMEDMDGNVYPMVQAVSGKCLPDKSWEDSAIFHPHATTKDNFRTAGTGARPRSSIT